MVAKRRRAIHQIAERLTTHFRSMDERFLYTPSVKPFFGSYFAMVFGLAGINSGLQGYPYANDSLVGGVTTILGALAFQSCKRRLLHYLMQAVPMRIHRHDRHKVRGMQMPHRLGNAELHPMHAIHLIQRPRIKLRRAANAIQIHRPAYLQRCPPCHPCSGENITLMATRSPPRILNVSQQNSRCPAYPTRNASSASPVACSTTSCKLFPCASIVTIATKSVACKCHIASGTPNSIQCTPYTLSNVRA